MEFRHLESFLAIADELHFGRAAARLHLAQPSLSQHLQRLERAVGVLLVSRTSHEVALTPAGEAFRVEAERIVGLAARSVEVARAAAAGGAGTVNVGFNFAAGNTVLPPTLARLTAEHPKLQPRLSERRTGPQLDALLSGELDVGFVYGPPRERLDSRELFALPLVAVLGRQHPWAVRESISMTELREQRCLLFDRRQSPAMHDALTRAAGQAGVELDVAQEVDDRLHTTMLLGTQPLLAFASAPSAARAVREGLVAVPLRRPVPHIDLRVVWRAGEETAPAVSAVLDSLVATAPARLGAAS